MNDSVLDIKATEDGTVFAALADGFVAVYQVKPRLTFLSGLRHVPLISSLRLSSECHLPPSRP